MPLYLAAGICNGVSSSINLNRYISEEDIQGRDILKGASQYIKEYKNDDPQEAFSYLKKSIEIASKLNENKIQEISDLEKEVISVSEEIGNIKSKTIYQPVFQSTADKIEKIIKENETKSGNLIKGILFGFASGLFLLGALCAYMSNRNKQSIQK